MYYHRTDHAPVVSSLTTSLKGRKDFAIRRLLADLEECISDPLPDVTALPLDSNLFIWHANLRGPSQTRYEGLVFHIVLSFLDTYPLQPPKVSTCTFIDHPNVFGSYICLDMLEEGAWSGQERNRPYTGWTSAYSVQSILIQLQVFLLGGARLSKKMREEALTFSCKTCNHSSDSIWPTFCDAEETFSKLRFHFAKESKYAGIPLKSALVARAEKEEEQRREQKKRKDAERKKKKREERKAPLQIEVPVGIHEDEAEALMSKSQKRRNRRKNRQQQKENENPQKQQNQKQQKQEKIEKQEKEAKQEKEEEPQVSDDWEDYYELNLETLPEETLVHILSYLGPRDVFSCMMLNKHFARICQDSYVWTSVIEAYFPYLARRVEGIDNRSAVGPQLHSKLLQLVCDSVKCFHSKVSFKDDVLGIPLDLVVTRNPDGRCFINEISSTLDLLSYTAFKEEGIRKAVWKEPFTHWLPVYIRSDHFARAERHFIESICSVINISLTSFRPTDVLEVLPKLMSTMTVSLMKGETHASLKALEGYCWFHRLFLEMVKKYPSLEKTIDNIISDFIRYPEGRNKKSIPSLGEFLPLLSVSKRYSWEDIAIPYFKEHLDRSAKWAIQKYPYLEFMLEVDSKMERNLVSWRESGEVGNKLLMFNVYFLRNIAKPKGKTVEDVMRDYDGMLGTPRQQMKEALQQEINYMHDCYNWQGLFKYVGIKCPSNMKALHDFLRDAIYNSKQKGYHRPSAPPSFASSFSSSSSSSSSSSRSNNDSSYGGRKGSGGGRYGRYN